MVELYSQIPKCALSLIRLTKARRSLSNAVALYPGGLGQKFELLSNKLMTLQEKCVELNLRCVHLGHSEVYKSLEVSLKHLENLLRVCE